MKKNGVFDILCKILSVLLSIVFVVMLIVTALFYSITNVLKPETLAEIITNIDYSEMLSGAVIENVSEKHTTLSFKPVILMGGTFTNSNTSEKITITPHGEVKYDIPVTEEDEDANPPDNVFYIDEGNIISFKGPSDDITKYSVNENGDIIYEGKVIAKVDEDNTGGEFAFSVVEGEIPFVNGESINSSDGSYFVSSDSAESIIGGADTSTSIVVSPSKNSGNSTESFFGEITENFSEKEVQIIESFMESDVAKEVLDEYANTVNDVLSGKDAKLDKEKIKKIIIDNKEEIMAFIEQNMGGEVDKETVSKEIEKFIDENIDEVLEVLPEPQEIVKELPKEIVGIINILNSGIILRALFTVDAILALLIFVLRLWDFAGFLWLGVDGIISSVILAFVYLAVNVFKGVFFNLVPAGQSIISSVFSLITGRILMGFASILITSIIFIIIFSIIKKFKRK